MGHYKENEGLFPKKVIYRKVGGHTGEVWATVQLLANNRKPRR